MLRKYYQLINDNKIVDRWYLEEPNSNDTGINMWDLISGKPIYYQESVRIPIQYIGPPLDFTFAGFDIPIVRKEVGKLIHEIDKKNIQRLPAIVGDIENRYEVLIISNSYECIDEKKSKILRWTENDGRPEKIGHIRMLTELHVNPNLLNPDFHIFRVKDFIVQIIISENLRQKLIQEGVTGIDFLDVS